jgi:hypothetical protein
MTNATIFVAVDPIYGRSYGLADREEHGQATKTFPMKKVTTDEWECDFSRIVPPGARILRVSGHFSDSGGVIVSLGEFIGGAVHQGTGVSADGVNPPWSPAALPVVGTLKTNTVPLFVDWERIARFEGLAGALVEVGAPDFIHASVEWEHISGVRLGCFALGVDGDAPPDVPALLAREELRLATPGSGMARIGVVSANAPLDVWRAAQAYPRGDNNYFVLAADLGAGAWQLPISFPENTPAKFRNHPSVFVRANMAIRGLHHPARFPYDVGSIDVNCADGAVGEPGIRIYVCNRAPTHSRWQFRIDSELLDVIIKHPNGSDFRRPRDIWNKVIAPTIGTAGGLGAPLPIYASSVAGTVRTFYQTGRLRGLDYLQGATFWEGLDAVENDQDPMYTRHSQYEAS